MAIIWTFGGPTLKFLSPFGGADPATTPAPKAGPTATRGGSSAGAKPTTSQAPPAGQADTSGAEDTSQAVQDRLFEAMDRLAIKMIEDLEAATKPGEDAITAKDRRETFRLGIEWLTKSKRFREDEDDTGGLPQGVEAMTRVMRGEIATKRRPAEHKKRTPARPARDPEEGAGLARALGGKR